MNRDSYPRLSRLADIAHLPSNREGFPNDYHEGDIARKVWKYYDISDTNMSPVDYNIKNSDNSHRVRTTLGLPSDTFIDTGEVVKDARFFSEYDFDVIDRVGIDTDDLWNGEVSDVTYKNGIVRVAKTDYYSTAPFTRLLSMEIADSQDITEEGSTETPLRDRYMRTEEQFKNPVRPVSASSGGIIIANKGDGEWVLMLGVRSDMTATNKGMISIFPNGKVEYDEVGENLYPTLVREFKEEIFSDNSKGDIYFDKHIESTDITSGWNLRTGSLTVSHVLMIGSRTAYEVFTEVSEHNEEVEEIIEIPVRDKDKIIDNINLDNTSGAAVAPIYESLMLMDESNKYPSLPYKIERL